MVNETTEIINTINETIGGSTVASPQVDGGNLLMQIWAIIEAVTSTLRTVSMKAQALVGIAPYQINFPLISTPLNIDFVILTISGYLAYYLMSRKFTGFDLVYLIKWTLIIFAILTFV